MQTNCILIASDFASRSPYRLQIHFLFNCCFIYLLWWSICGTGNLSQQTSLQCLSTVSIVFSDEDKILIKFYLQSAWRKTRYLNTENIKFVDE